ncbi:plant virulence effector HPE1-like domain-containing protein [Rhizobium sp. YS-1r]|uniref:plant virulence effector HPE1-like domain-containing protein n=1 Tax=Rhizobium sp. YS-1r TaxID=1532558 RepID=UPI00068C79A4|nr:plant virulence effector HPE1-like domain-containing protein [Rhizobium sp. YS-1r]
MHLVLTTALVLASGAAFASSITTISGANPSGASIVEKRCTDCPVPKPRANESTYKVPELANGIQKTEIIDINGEKKLVRTEAWFGGSPVIYISKLPDWMATDSAIAELHPTTDGSTETGLATLDGIDLDATTSAVATDGTIEPVQASAVSVAAAFNELELRLRPIE